MKTLSKRKSLYILAAAIFSVTFIQGCAAFMGIRVENDSVKSTRRITARFTHEVARENHSPLVRVNQSIVKELRGSQLDTYTVFDVVTLRGNSFKLSDEVYVIVDDQPFQVKILQHDMETISKIMENKSSILAADSTSVSVVTGYNQYQHHVTRLSYTLDNSVIEKMKFASKVQYRYYAGPDVITIRLRGTKLNSLKMLLNKS